MYSHSRPSAVPTCVAQPSTGSPRRETRPIPAFRALLVLTIIGPLVCMPEARATCGGPRPSQLAPTDWSSIRAAREAGRLALFGDPGGWRARNRGQGWSSYFDGRGAMTTPDHGEWSWGLELTSFGFEGRASAVECPRAAHAEGARIDYEWSCDLTEWWVNGQQGLEHGFTVNRRPTERGADANSPLVFDLTVRGGLHPQVTADRRGAKFVDSKGDAVLSYDGLAAYDADGVRLDAWLEVGAEEIQLLVLDLNARYPIRVDPIAQQAYLKASNTEATDYFGWSVALSGDTAVIGALGEDSSATGVNGNEADNGAAESGAVYVFIRSGSTWSQQAYLKPSNIESGDQFGIVVAIDGDTIVAGAPGEASSSTGVNGNQADNSKTNAGAAYVFVRSGTTWTQQAYLKASNTDTQDRFGNGVDVSGDTIVVGAPGEASNAPGIDGNQASNIAPGAGAAYVFFRSGTTWSQQAYLKASNPEGGDEFGLQFPAVSGDTIVIPAQGEDSNAVGVDGVQNNNGSLNSGAAYVFFRTGAIWSQQAYLKASNTGAGDGFGTSLDVSGDIIVVGAIGEDSSATGINGSQLSNGAANAGAAYVFVRSNSTWSFQTYLKASNTNTLDWFGVSVSTSGDRIVVGALQESSNATGINGNQANNSALGAGAAYEFVSGVFGWRQRAYLKSSSSDIGDHFGAAVASSGDTVLVGVPAEGSSAVGVNGSAFDNSALNSGAAYVFTFPAENDLCTDARVVGFTGGTITDSLTDAGNDGSSTCDGVGRDVWYAYKNLSNSSTRILDLNTCGSTFDTVLTVYASCGGAQIACNDDCGGTPCGATASCISGITVNPLQTVLIRLSDKGLSGADYTLDVTVNSPTPPNDDCATPIALMGPGHYNLDNSGATTGTQGQASALCAVQGGAALPKDVWYSFTPITDGVASVSTCGLIPSPPSLSPDSKIAVYLGAGCPTGPAIACDDDTGELGGPACSAHPWNSTVSFPLTCGATYMIQIGMYYQDPDWIMGQFFFNVSNETIECPTPFTVLCSGDGTDTPCPCSNTGLAGRGCENTVSSGGAALASTGKASISSDTLELDSTFAVPFGPGLYYEGNATANPTAPFGVSFGNGLRCAGGTTNRLEIRVADGVGSANTTASLQILGGATAGTTYYYQLWYRDGLTSMPLGTCNPTSHGFNFSNAISLVWGP